MPKAGPTILPAPTPLDLPGGRQCLGYSPAMTPPPPPPPPRHTHTPPRSWAPATLNIIQCKSERLSMIIKIIIITIIINNNINNIKY